MLPVKHNPISLPLVAVTILLVASYVDAEHFYPKCYTSSGATRNPKARGKCAFHCPLDKKHTVCGTDGKHYHNECFLCRHACVKVTLSKACNGPCPCKNHKNHAGRQAVNHNAHHKQHLKHGQAPHPHHANGMKRKMRRKIYKLRKGKQHIRKKNVHANKTMRNHHKKHDDKRNYLVRRKLRHGVKHKRMKGHKIIVKKGGRNGNTNHRSIQKNNRPKWLNGFGKSIQQWALQGNGRRDHNAYVKKTDTRRKNGRAGKRVVYKISKKRGSKHRKAYRKMTKKPRGIRYGFFKKRMLRSKRKRKRKHKQ